MNQAHGASPRLTGEGQERQAGARHQRAWCEFGVPSKRNEKQLKGAPVTTACFLLPPRLGKGMNEGREAIQPSTAADQVVMSVAPEGKRCRK